MSQPYYPLHALTEQLQPRGVGLTERFKALGGRSEKINKSDCRLGGRYEFYDKNGHIVARTISEAWRWICAQQGVTKPRSEQLTENIV